MGQGEASTSVTILALLLRPVARFCLSRSLKLQDFIAAAKVAFVEEARAELARTGTKVNVSRVSVATGIHRQDTGKILTGDLGAGLAASPKYPLDIVARVINQWQNNKQFLTSGGTPRSLAILGSGAQFPKLVASVSTDVNPSTVLFELERSGHVRREGNVVALIRGAFSPSHDTVQGYRIVARDIDDLVRAASRNIEGEAAGDSAAVPNLHARTEFDNIRPERLEEIRAWLVTEGHKLHRAVREYLSRFDQDSSPDPTFNGKGVTVSLGTFALIDNQKRTRPLVTQEDPE